MNKKAWLRARPLDCAITTRKQVVNFIPLSMTSLEKSGAAHIAQEPRVPELNYQDQLLTAVT